MVQQREPVDPRRLWFGVALPVVVWVLHLVIAYAVQSVSCHWGFLQFSLLGINALRLLLLALTILAAAGIFWGGWTSYSNYQRLRDIRQDRLPTAQGRLLFMTQGAALLAGLFMLSILFSLVPILFLEHCSRFWW